MPSSWVVLWVGESAGWVGGVPLEVLGVEVCVWGGVEGGMEL